MLNCWYNNLFKRDHKKIDERFELNPNNYYLISFPKSGNTWVRFLLANALFDENHTIDFAKLGQYVPDLGRGRDKSIIRDPNSAFNRASRKFVKTHSIYSPAFRKVIYIVRDGRDALTSYYYWINARVENPVSLSDVIRANVPPPIPRGLWSDHVLGWIQGKCDKKLVVKYEDLLEDTEQELEKIFRFSGLKVERERMIISVIRSSFKNLRKIEEVKGIFDGKIPAIEKVPFTRKGVVGGWKELFSEAEHKLFWKFHGEAMKIMKYEE